MESLAGVTQVRINPAASSIVIQYQPSICAIAESAIHTCEKKAQEILDWFDQEVLVDRGGYRQWMSAKEGDRITVIAEQRIPLDGWIAEGNALIDERSSTGEQSP
ncbi:hypothetical protein H6F89_20465 [Cyanobacteria bacterium FACHB-63]|nr:hypothetical protein [Cyanobacteria bacterium FACHB-63]